MHPAVHARRCVTFNELQQIASHWQSHSFLHGQQGALAALTQADRKINSATSLVQSLLVPRHQLHVHVCVYACVQGQAERGQPRSKGNSCSSWRARRRGLSQRLWPSWTASSAALMASLASFPALRSVACLVKHQPHSQLQCYEVMTVTLVCPYTLRTSLLCPECNYRNDGM